MVYIEADIVMEVYIYDQWFNWIYFRYNIQCYNAGTVLHSSKGG